MKFYNWLVDQGVIKRKAVSSDAIFDSEKQSAVDLYSLLKGIDNRREDFYQQRKD